MNIILSDRWLYTICILLAAGIFAIDLQLPLGVASGAPYILVILVSLWSSKKRTAIHLAILCTGLTILGFFYSPSGGELWKVLLNRALALFVIWVTAILALMWKIHEEKISSIRNQMEKEKEKIYLATIHGAQHIINNLLNQLKLIQFKAKSGEALDGKTLVIFDEILAEANTLMRNLAEVDQMDEKEIKQSIHTKTRPTKK